MRRTLRHQAVANGRFPFHQSCFGAAEHGVALGMRAVILAVAMEFAIP
jgi:hypothetical protein